jgi:redox-sensitive bicupin YhaK (pirin superfamily)
MLQGRNASNRGRAELGWLDSRHTFSFGDYYDPHHMGSGWIQVARGEVTVNGTALSAGDGAAVLNEDRLSIRGTVDAEVLLFDLV